MGNYFTTAEPEVQKPRQKIKWSLLFPRGHKEKSCRIEGLKLSVISSPLLPPPSRLSNSISCGVYGDSLGRENYIAVPRAVKSQDRKSQQDICGRGKTGLGAFFSLTCTLPLMFPIMLPVFLAFQCWFGRNVTCDQRGTWTTTLTTMGVCHTYTLSEYRVHLYYIYTFIL